MAGPVDIVTSMFTTAQVKTSFFELPPINLKGALEGPPGLLSRLLKPEMMKPTIILDGPSGRVVIAPFGEANPGARKYIPLMALGAVFVVGVAVGSLL